MANSLETILRNGPNVTANTTPMYKLPNNAGSYSSAGTTAPIFAGAVTPPPPAPAPVQAPAPVDLYAKYRDPKTGNIMSPEEYALYLGNRVPKRGTGDVPQTAGDAMMFPDESSADLTRRATNLNNTRNDIATGTTDPYKVGAESGVAYSPAELAAIEKAYAGVYDPALNDVFARLKTREEEAKKKQDREDKIFATNESIRQWKATTGTKSSGDGDKSLFTQTQLNNAARNSGLDATEFAKIDDYDLINFFVSPPTDTDETTGKKYPMNKTFSNLVKLVTDGEMSAQDATDEILGSDLPDTVKHYYIDQLPLTVEEKKGYWAKLWGAIKGE
jgi:hypothetical protein